MKNLFLPLVAVVLLFTSCADDNFQPKNYDQVSANYQLIYDEAGNNGTGSYAPFAYFANDEGFATQLESGHSVYFNEGLHNDQLIFQSYGYYYSASSTYSYSPANMQADFILNTPDGKSFTNTVALDVVTVDDYDAQLILNEDFVISWGGEDLAEGDVIKAYILDENDAILATETLAYDEENEATNDITFEAKYLSFTSTGIGSIILERYTIDEFTDTFGINTSYTTGVYRTADYAITIVNGVDE